MTATETQRKTPEEIDEILIDLALTDLAYEQLDKLVYTEDDVDDMMTKGAKITIGTVEAMQTRNLTVVNFAVEITFPTVIRGQVVPETWRGEISGEARRNPKDKTNSTIGVLAAFADAMGRIERDITRRLEGELKHAEDCQDNRARRVHAKKKPIPAKKIPAHLLERFAKRT